MLISTSTYYCSLVRSEMHLTLSLRHHLSLIVVQIRSSFSCNLFRCWLCWLPEWSSLCWWLLCLYCVHLVSWSSKKQDGVSRTSTEVEYWQLAYTDVAISWFRSLFRELHLSMTCPKLWCENISAIFLASNLVFHTWTYHVEVDY